MTRNPEDTRRLFDAWAATYDRDVADPAGPLAGYEESLWQAVAALDLPPGARTLDIGIGTGAFAARLAGRGAQVWGLDPSRAMLARCRAAYPAFALAVGGFGPLPFAAGRFDAVVASFAAHEIPPADRLAAWSEVARVLRPGGAICLLDLIFASPAAVAEARRRLGDSWDDAEEYPLVGELDGQLRAAGFAALRWRQTAPCHWVVTGRRASGEAAGSGGE
jgi:putative AdoMet-dependent methyltransferase